MKKWIYCIGLLIAGLLSCSQPEVVSNPVQHFDLKGYLAKEVEDLSDLKTVKKEISYNEQSETKTDSNFSIQEKLSLFEKADINRIALIGKYTIDSVLTSDNKLEAIRYQSKSATLKPQKLNVYFDSKQEVERIEITQSIDNWINQSDQKLIYEKGKGYSIRTKQSGLFGAADQHIQVSFVQ